MGSQDCRAGGHGTLTSPFLSGIRYQHTWFRPATPHKTGMDFFLSHPKGNSDTVSTSQSEEGIRRAIEWERANPIRTGDFNSHKFDYAAEDAALEVATE